MKTQGLTGTLVLTLEQFFMFAQGLQQMARKFQILAGKLEKKQILKTGSQSYGNFVEFHILFKGQRLMPRENRDRRDKERREDRRDRDRHRGSRRDRDYDRSGDSVTGTNLNISGPVVLLKRPDAGQSSGSSASSSATTGSSVYERSGNKSSDIQRDGSQTNVAGNAKPPSLLVRSGQWKKGSVPDVRGNTSSPVPTSDNAEVKIVVS